MPKAVVLYPPSLRQSPRAWPHRLLSDEGSNPRPTAGLHYIQKLSNNYPLLI